MYLQSSITSFFGRNHQLHQSYDSQSNAPTISTISNEPEVSTTSTASFTPTVSTSFVQPFELNEVNHEHFVDISSLPIYYNNVRSITCKRNINMRIDQSVYKVLCFTETWLTASHSSSLYFPSRFNVFRCDRSANAERAWGGGVAVLVCRKLNSRRVQLNGNNTSEFVAVEIKLEPTPLLLYAVYIRKFKDDVASEHLRRIHELIAEFPRHRIMLLGDFNLYNVRWTADESERYFVPTGLASHASQYFRGVARFLGDTLDVPLYQLSNIQNAASNVLDLLFVNDYVDVRIAVDQSMIIERSQQDICHMPYEILFEYSKRSIINQREKVNILCYKRGNYQRMCRQLDGVNFAHEVNRRNVNSAFDYFFDVMDTITRANVPSVTVTTNTNRPKWWTNELQRLKNVRNKLYKRKLRGGDESEYLAALNRFDKLNEHLRTDYVTRVQANIASDPSAFWNYAKLNSKSSAYPNEMRYNENVGTTPQAIVESFADHFESIYVPDEEEWSFEGVYQSQPSFTEIAVSLFDIERAVGSLKWGGGLGSDMISPYVVKKCVDSIVWPIWLLFQKTMEGGVIPERLKLSRIVPVFKKGDKADIKNYRVVSIGSTLLRVFERAVNFKLTSIIEPRLSNAQHGFRPRRSITTNLLNLSIAVHKGFDKGNQTDVFYGDFANAFDTVWHRRLVEKLMKFKIGEKTAKWLCEFVIGRSNLVKIGNETSRIYESPSGVPAGSSLGPLLFSVFINDMVDVVRLVSILLFADDFKILKQIANSNDTRRLQENIDNILGWCIDNRLPLNEQKCAIFTAGRIRSPIETNYSIGNQRVERKNEIRDLGVTLDQKFTFGTHIENITTSARRMTGYIKHVSHGDFTVETQRILYMAYVRSKLEFGSVIWSPYQGVYSDNIESVQKQFVIHLLGSRRNATSFRLSPYRERCAQLRLQPLRDRRDVIDALCAFDIYVGRINDTSINSNFYRLRPHRDMRDVNVVAEPSHRTDYLSSQPLARLRRTMNNFANKIRFDSRSRFESFAIMKVAEFNDV